MFSKIAITAVAVPTLTLLSFFTSPTQAAQVLLSNQLELLDVDGHTNSNILHSVELPKGSHVLVVRYRDLFSGVNADAPSIWVKSQPLFLQVVIASEKITLAPPPLDNEDEANAYLKHPYLTLTPDKGANTKLSLLPMTSVITNLLSAKD
ncbi:DUF2057 family protein [Shewanella dokdonensis]|uniref:DUF2057 family protein n=1 Tax=Shewanella dokdonensis TaxID=712036 RepID=A0ABX8DCL4_9GAMM|nr:DUF2057 family protein [Shewanella dokdonensis]MCL1075278.1 DUF2057 domain-containing protein [Shewanella dokdonensis]QVK21996.1 DUF2057 family protein [Shewanella dokdonensis]